MAGGGEQLAPGCTAFAESAIEPRAVLPRSAIAFIAQDGATVKQV